MYIRVSEKERRDDPRRYRSVIRGAKLLGEISCASERDAKVEQTRAFAVGNGHSRSESELVNAVWSSLATCLSQVFVNAQQLNLQQRETKRLSRISKFNENPIEFLCFLASFQSSQITCIILRVSRFNVLTSVARQ